MLARTKDALVGKRRESQGGGARRAHDLEQADRMVGWGLRKLGMGKEELEATPKGQAEKQVLAWRLHGHTTASRRWIAEELRMGYESRVSQAVSWVEASRARNVVEMKRRLKDYDG